MRKKGIHVFILGTIEDKDSIPRLTPIDRVIEKFIVDKGQPLEGGTHVHPALESCHQFLTSNYFRI
jgi:hypothetical protein